MVEGRRENRKLVRLIMDHHVRVSIGSLGSDVRYELQTKNISYTGFFLDYEKPGRFPFTSSSIMDISIQLSKDLKIEFNGKMVRRVMPGEPGSEITGPGIAVKIVQIDTKTEQKLKDFIDRTIEDRQKSLSDKSTDKSA
jgi:hypothetical protein